MAADSNETLWLASPARKESVRREGKSFSVDPTAIEVSE
jgi:hypothetical protein